MANHLKNETKITKVKKLSVVVLAITLVFSWTVDVQAVFTMSNGIGLAGNVQIASHASLSQSENILHVPGDLASLQDAIYAVSDGGIIELAAGIYFAPEDGFRINDLGKGFTIRAVSGATVVLDGGGNYDILRFINSSLSHGKPVTFEGITFANGRSTTHGVAGGVSLHSAQATFINCTFRDNQGAQSSTGGGGVLVAVRSTAFFIDCTWENNTATQFGGGLAVEDYSRVYIHSSTFTNNRTNIPGHSVTAAGGGIHVGNSTLRVSETLFEGNQAGYVGGAIYAIGTWTDPVSTPQSDVIIVDSTFISNEAVRDPSVSSTLPTEGGAVHAEDQTLIKIHGSSFVKNKAHTGGGVNLYRAEVKITDSVFQGNQATGTGPANGFGGAISAVSNDTSNATTGYGGINRPSARLTVEDTLIQGQYDSVTTVAQIAGGIYATGDTNRHYGINGVSKMGTLADNRAVVTLNGVILSDLDVQEDAGVVGTGMGGGILVDIVDLTMQDSMVIDSDAIGSNYSSGGGIAVIQHSIANISDTTIAHNSAGKYGGGVYAQGVTINLTNCNLIGNIINSNYGSAIFTAPMLDRGLAVDGVVQDCMIVDNVGLPIFDDDGLNAPYNTMRYDGNQFFDDRFLNGGEASALIYSNSIANVEYRWRNTSELNDLVIVHSNGTSTPKSLVPNTALTSAPAVGALLAAPTALLLPINTSGYSMTQPRAYLGYISSGDSVTLNSQTLTSSSIGVIATNESGQHTLSVDESSYTAEVLAEIEPLVSFSVVSGDTYDTLVWSLEQGTFLDVAIDQGVTIPSSPYGSVQVPARNNRTYHLFTVTEEGGVVATVDTSTPKLDTTDSLLVLVGLNLPANYGYLTITNKGGGVLHWEAQSSDPSLIQLETTSGETEASVTLKFSVNSNGLTAGEYYGHIDIDAGESGIERVPVTIVVVDILHQVFLPFAKR